MRPGVPWPLRLALRFYPASFRTRFGSDYTQFVQLERAAVDPSTLAICGFWIKTVGEAARNGLAMRHTRSPGGPKWASSTQSIGEMMMGIGKDLRFAVRAARRDPLYLLVAIVTLTLGIGSTTAIYTVVDNVLLRPLPYDSPHELLGLTEIKQGGTDRDFSWPDYRDLKEQVQGVSQLAAVYETSGILTEAGDATVLQGAAVSHDLFSLLRVQPARGRGFTPEEDSFNGPFVVVLGWSLWQNRFGADPDIVGNTMKLGGDSYSVIGVMPRGFGYPTSTTAYWTPIREDRLLVEAGLPRDQRGLGFLSIIARTHASIGQPGAESALNVAYTQINETAGRDASATILMTDLQDWTVGDVGQSLLVFLWASLLVLGIACANLANLSLAKALSRTREFAVRTAIGAQRGHIIRQVLAESLLVAGIGAALGLFLALGILGIVLGLVPEGLVETGSIGLDSRVLGFTVTMAAVSGIAAGLIPALRSAKANPGDSLGGSSRGNSAGPRRTRLQTGLVVAQVALSVILLSGAGLLLRSFQALSNQALGFEPSGVVVAQIELPETGFETDVEVLAFYQELFESIESIPGVIDATATYSLPFEGNHLRTTLTKDSQDIGTRENREWARLVVAADGYFSAMGIPILRGRAFSQQDRLDQPKVAVINEAMAQRLWPGEDPVGRIFAMGTSISGSVERMTKAYFDGEITVIGVVGNERREALSEDILPEYYRPHAQIPWRGLSLIVRTDGASTAVVPQIRNALERISSTVPLEDVRTLGQQVARAAGDARLRTLIASLFAAVAALLTMVGIYGVTAFAVTQRYREIGVRKALGAQQTQIMSMVLGSGLRTTVLGLIIGLPGAVIAARYVSSMLFGTSVSDPLTYLSVVVLVVTTTLLAAWVPARRAAHVNPVQILGGE